MNILCLLIRLWNKRRWQNGLRSFENWRGKCALTGIFEEYPPLFECPSTAEADRDRAGTRTGDFKQYAATGGYYRPETTEEIRRFIRMLENRGVKTLAALKGARKMLEQLERVE